MEEVWTWKHIVLLWKNYFDTGMALTTLPRMGMQLFAQVLGIGGIMSGRKKYVHWAVISAAAYFLSCLVIGWAFYHYGWVQVSNDVSNYFNPLLMRMDESIREIKGSIK